MDKQNPASDKKKRKLRLLIILGIIVLLAAGFLLVRQLDIGRARRQEAALEKALTVDALDAQTEFRVQVAPDDLSLAEGLDPDWYNVLLLGTDERHGILNQGRSDAIMVLSINTDSGEMKLTSLVRDLLVPIPGASSNDKLTHANKYGGPLLAVKTVNEALGLNIAHYVSVNFSGFIRAVNVLGGVDLKLDDKVISAFRLEPGKEIYHLSGAQALDFVRIRHIDNNFGRNERQRQFLSAMLDQARRQDSGLVMNALAESLKAMTTNLSVSDLMFLSQKVLSGKSNPSMLSLPPAGQYHYGKDANGNSAVVSRLDRLKENFHNFVYEGDLSGTRQEP
ncbi:MAG TPA: LCP family protein [Clostridia bacterium]|nr:LCP family protein [Clostridia bacterium]